MTWKLRYFGHVKCHSGFEKTVIEDDRGCGSSKEGQITNNENGQTEVDTGHCRHLGHEAGCDLRYTRPAH